MPIGGVKEKVTSAHRLGVKTIVLPKHNEKDLEDIPDHIKKDLKFHFADDMKDVIKAAIPTLKMEIPKKGGTKK